MGGVGGGGQKFLLKRLQAVGKHIAHHTTDVRFAVGSSNPGLLTFGAGGGAKFGRPGFEPPTKGTLVGCITTRPLPGLK